MSAEILALHRESAVSAAKAARIDAHLAGCAKCSGIDAALTSLASVLAATELPAMPEAVGLRIQMAITRESAARSATGHALAAPAPAGSARIPGRPDLAERRRSRSRWFRTPDWSSPLLLRGLAAAAAVVVIAGAGILLANARTASQGSGAGLSEPRARAPAAPTGVAGGTGNSASHGVQAGGRVTVSYRTNGRIATAPVVVSDANVTQRSLPDRVRKQVASVPGFRAVTGAPTSQASLSQKLRIGGVSVLTLEGCLSTVSSGRQVLLVDVARFLNRPATIIVLKSPTTVSVLDVTIVGFGCSASSADIIRTLTVPVR